MRTLVALNWGDAPSIWEDEHINTGINQGREVTCSQGIKTQAELFWSHGSERRPGEDVHVWNGK